MSKGEREVWVQGEEERRKNKGSLSHSLSLLSGRRQECLWKSDLLCSSSLPPTRTLSFPLTLSPLFFLFPDGFLSLLSFLQRMTQHSLFLQKRWGEVIGGKKLRTCARNLKTPKTTTSHIGGYKIPHTHTYLTSSSI